MILANSNNSSKVYTFIVKYLIKGTKNAAES